MLHFSSRIYVCTLDRVLPEWEEACLQPGGVHICLAQPARAVASTRNSVRCRRLAMMLHEVFYGRPPAPVVHPSALLTTEA